MKCKVLQLWTSNSSGGVPRFLAMWQEDALKAISDCLMGDRDSYPGQYIHQLIEHGFILADEVEYACLQWLKEERYKEKYGHLSLDDVISLPSRRNPKFAQLSSYIATHFDELLCQDSNGSIEHKLISGAALSHDLNRATWNKLDALFKEKYWSDVGLFEALYFRDQDSFASHEEREHCLQQIAKKARCMKRAYGDNESAIGSLRFMLYSHLLGYPNMWVDDLAESFAIISARVERWLASQNAFMPAK